MYLYNPEGFDPLQYLPTSLKKYCANVRWFFHHLYVRRVMHKMRSDEFIPCYAKYLRKVLPKDHYRAVLDALLPHVLECDGYWIKDEKSKGYRPIQELRDRPWHLMQVNSKALERKIQRDRARRQEKIVLPVHKHLWRHLQAVEIDIAGIRKRRYKDTRMVAPTMIAEQDWYFNVDDRGRVTTNATGLKTTMRRFLSVNGQKLANIDIRNSQPLLLCLLLYQYFSQDGKLSSFYSYDPVRDFQGGPEAHLSPIETILSPSRVPPPSPCPIRCPISLVVANLPPDVVQYAELVQEGRLYEFMMDHCPKKHERASYKRYFFGSVLYAANSKMEKELIFKNLFPSVYEAIRKFKEKDYRWLPLELQYLESSIIIHRVVKRMMDQYPETFVTTIHDSVMTTTADVEKVIGVMQKEFWRLCLVPQLKVEQLT